MQGRIGGTRVDPVMAIEQIRPVVHYFCGKTDIRYPNAKFRKAARIYDGKMGALSLVR